MKFSKLLLTVLAIGLALTVLGCSGGRTTTPSKSSGGSASSTTVVEQGKAFDPATLAVKVDDTVTFKNDDSVSHNVEIDGQTLGLQNPGESVSWKATSAGSFPYRCTIHPSMTGEIVVK